MSALGKYPMTSSCNNVIDQSDTNQAAHISANIIALCHM